MSSAPEGSARVAVIGSGVSGLVAAHVLSRSRPVTLFEADDRLGGHADTHVVSTSTGPLAIDTGFIVHNEQTYPVLTRLFRELGIQTQDSEMSMSVRDIGSGLEWAGALGLGGLFPSWRNALRPAHLRMLTEIPRFHRMARRLLAEEGGEVAGGERLADFLDRGGFSDTFRTHFMESLVACVWSCDAHVALDYPARYLFTFLDHHGMLQVFGSPRWRTVTGGSHEYVDRVAAPLDDVRLGAKVVGVRETATGVLVTDGNGHAEQFAAAVVATHPDQALAMLEEPTSAQRELLAALPYSRNTAQLHTDERLLPRAARARASWNYLRREPADAAGPVTVTYDLTRLMRLDSTDEGGRPVRHLVTLGGADLVDPERVLATMEYAHPLYTPASVAAQQRMEECDGDRLVFAGAWRGWGFHEDGARSGLAAAERLGAGWDVGGGAGAVTAASSEPRLYATTIRHVRRTPWKRSFTQHNHTWLVDLDHLPRRGFAARDHLGDPSSTIRANLDRFLAAHGEERPARVLMAANARAFGYCFNPISVFWCFRADGSRGPVVVEVHNTYGDRHAYLVHPDEQGRARTEKQLYVSPFHGTDGHYEIAVPVPDEQLQIAVTLHSDDGATFSASLAGRRTTATALRAAPAALLGSLQIRLHGWWLWARRLPVRPRPVHPPQEGVR